MFEKLNQIFKPENRRKFPRFKSNAFLGAKVHGAPLPPFYGDPVDGYLLNLSAGGMAVQLTESIPNRTKLYLELSFPDHSKLECNVHVCHVSHVENLHIIGIQFEDLAPFMKEKIENMAQDFLNCEKRIKNKKKEPEVCRPDCAFFSMCTKDEKKELEQKLENQLILKFSKKAA